MNVLSFTVFTVLISLYASLVGSMNFELVQGAVTYLILLGSIRSMSLSFFQKSCGGGEASTLHSNRTVSPSSAREFDIFWTKVGGRRTSWAAGARRRSHEKLEGTPECKNRELKDKQID